MIGLLFGEVPKLVTRPILHANASPDTLFNITLEILNLFFKDSTRKAEYRCEIGEDLYNRYFQTLLVEIQKQKKKDKFIGRLCEGQKEYFLALTFENGFGYKEDFREAYRLF
jgi:hypothetical protein